MIEPELSPEEPARLDALRRTKQLDTPLDERFERITRLAQRLLNTPIAAISLVDSDRQWFKSIQGLDVAETSRGVSFCSHAILRDELLLVPDARLDQRFSDNPLVSGAPNIVFYAGYPVHASDGQKIGALCVIDRKTREFSADDAQTLRDLAGVAESEFSAAMQSAVQKTVMTELDEVSRKSQVDSLTRIWNRDSIFTLLDKELTRSRRDGRGNGAIMADIDHFKQINDTYGHPVGDEVLRQVAKRILSSIREDDALGRYGGEEFMIVMGPCDGIEGVRYVAERICARVAERPFATSGGSIPVTLSLGGAFGDVQQALTGDGLIRAADAALYRAKRAGRNRVDATRI